MTSSAIQLSENLATLIESTSPSVVRVEARRRVPATGVVWGDGTIVAASHAIRREDHIEVGLPDGTTTAAELAGRDNATDLAVLKVSNATLPAAAWSESGALRVGNLVVALARPGRTVRAALGIVSARGDAWRTPAGGKVDHYLETDVDLGPGFSGGPLVDLEGRVVGLNTTGLLRGRSLTVPTVTLRRVVEALLAKGKLERGYLGIGSTPVRLPAGLAESLGQAAALLVLSVEPKSPADQAGVTLGDALVSLDGRPTRSIAELLELLDEERIGTAARVKVVRAGAVKELDVTIGSRSW